MRWIAVVGCVVFVGLAQAADPVGSGKPVLALDTGFHLSRIVDFAFSGDSRELYSASLDGTVRVWDLEAGGTVRVFRPPLAHLSAVRGVAHR